MDSPILTMGLGKYDRYLHKKYHVSQHDFIAYIKLYLNKILIDWSELCRLNKVEGVRTIDIVLK